MKNMFYCLLNCLKNHGKVTAASMDENADITIKLKSDKHEYTVTVTKNTLPEV